MKSSIKLLAATMICSSTLGAMTAFAGENGDTTTSNGQVTFKPSSGEGSVTPPAEPEKPGKPVFPVDPTNPGGKPNPGTQGPLSLDFASSFDFGEQEITSADMDYKAKAQLAADEEGNEFEMPNFVQITDNRGTEAGWTLKVTQGEQFKAVNKTGKELTGAVITLGNANFYSHSESSAATGATSIALTPGKSEVAMSAKVDTGAGTQFTQWGTEAEGNAADSVNLFVPGKTTKFADKYTTVLNWELSDTVGNYEA